MSEPTWPEAELDPVRRLRVMASVLPGVALLEREIDAPYDEVWSRLADLEGSVPDLDPMVASVRVLSRDGDRLTIKARTPFMPVATRFDVVLQDGWCWMQSRVYLVGMAAVPHGDRTLYAHLEGLPWRRTGIARPLLRRLIRLDVAGIVRMAEGSRRSD